MSNRIRDMFDEIEALQREIHARVVRSPDDQDYALRRHLMIALEQHIRHHPSLRDSAE